MYLSKIEDFEGFYELKEDTCQDTINLSVITSGTLHYLKKNDTYWYVYASELISQKHNLDCVYRYLHDLFYLHKKTVEYKLIYVNEDAAQDIYDYTYALNLDASSIKTIKLYDTVNQPEHYAAGSIECIQAIEASMSAEEFKGFLKGNVEKYIWRYRYKSKPLQDLEKAKWYLERLISVAKKENES